MTLVPLIATVLLVGFFILLQGFFSGSETGLYVVNRIRLRLRAEARQVPAVRLAALLADLRGLITTCLVGTNLSVFASSALVTRLVAGRLHNAAFVSTLVLSPLLFIFAEVVPKNLFRRHADVLIYRASGLLALAAIAFRPLVFVLKGITSFWDLLFGKPVEPRDPVLSRERLLSLLMTGTEEGILTPYQHDVAGNILRIASVTVERAMIPLDRAVVVREPIQPQEVAEALARGGHSRYPIQAADGAIDRILDVTAHLIAQRAGGPAEAGIRSVHRLPADTPVPRALETLQTARDPMGLVVDAADRPLGIVTVKDLVEEIVGELGEW